MGQDRIRVPGRLKSSWGSFAIRKGLKRIGIVGASGWGSSKGDEDSGSLK